MNTRFRLSSRGWLTNVGLKAVGGEVQPTIQNTVFSSNNTADAFINCMKSVNVSVKVYYMQPHVTFDTCHFL